MDFKAGLFTAAGAAFSASTDLTLRIQRDIDLWFLDFNDDAFKAAGHVTLDLGMAEPDAVRAPGWYWGNYQDALVGLWDDGVYTVYINNLGVDVPPAWHDIIEVRIINGVFAGGTAEGLSTQAQADVDAAVSGLTVDGTRTLQDVLSGVLSHIMANAIKVGNTVTMFRQDGVTPIIVRTQTSTTIVTVFTP